jgi:hypothetical protein
VEGINFGEIFAAVAKFNTIRVILAIAAAMGLEIHQMDVKTAFLDGELDVEIYMEQPEGFVQKCQEHLVSKLKKSLYRLKQYGHSHIICVQRLYEEPCGSLVVRVANLLLNCDCNHICRQPHHFGKQCKRDQRVEV